MIYCGKEIHINSLQKHNFKYKHNTHEVGSKTPKITRKETIGQQNITNIQMCLNVFLIIQLSGVKAN